MNISKTIREQRGKLSLSQEELAEKVYVTRQTIGNWENDKSYPDIHSLILLSQVFDMTIDNLIKGDLELMKQTIEHRDMTAYKWHSAVYYIGIFFTVILFTLSWHFEFTPGIVASALIFVGVIYSGIKLELIQRRYDVQTFREIIAFTKGETLDEITKVRESGKRIYQGIFFAIIMVGLGLALAYGVKWLVHSL